MLDVMLELMWWCRGGAVLWVDGGGASDLDWRVVSCVCGFWHLSGRRTNQFGADGGRRAPRKVPNACLCSLHT